jgi:hypothetical protein
LNGKASEVQVQDQDPGYTPGKTLACQTSGAAATQIQAGIRNIYLTFDLKRKNL